MSSTQVQVPVQGVDGKIFIAWMRKSGWESSQLRRTDCLSLEVS